MIKLIFVYNANSGKLDALFDAGHKLFSPGTYQCDLCALTFDTFTENKIWKTFRNKSKIDMEFYHIDEFEKAFPKKIFEYPIIIKQNQYTFEPFMTKKDLKKIKTVQELINIISQVH